MPSVGIDAFNISLPTGTGIAVYGKNLNTALRALGAKTQLLYGPPAAPGPDALLNEIALLDPTPPRLGRLHNLANRLSPLVFPLGRTARPIDRGHAVLTTEVAHTMPACDRLWVSQDIFHGANRAFSATGRMTTLDMGAEGPDVMHWTCSLPLWTKGRANFYTIHDLVPLRLPYATLDNKRRFLTLNREICRRADRIATVSEHSKRDIVEILGVDEARVFVTHQAVVMPQAALQRSDADVVNELDGVFGLDWRGYFLFFGAIEPKKNLARMIEAYLAANIKTPLVIVGAKAWLDGPEARMFDIHQIAVDADGEGAMERKSRIRRYDYLPSTLLTSLIRGARATLMCSLYEGFGLPVLESMLLGTPVLTSTEGSLPEVAGDAALLVNPYDSHAICKAIQTLDADADLRADLAQRGLRQAKKFSPEAYQLKLRELYRQHL